MVWATDLEVKKMNRTIKWYLIVSFISISFVIISAFSILTLKLMDTHFINYVSERQEKQLSNYTSRLENLYEDKNLWPETDEFESIGLDAMQNSIFLKLYDNDKKQIWSSSYLEQSMNKSNHTMKNNSLHMESKMGSMMVDSDSNNETTTFSLFSGNQKIGVVDFSYMGPIGYSDHDSLFISDMKNSLIVVAIVGSILSICFAVLVADKISGPLVNVKIFTKDISKGTYTNAPPETTHIKELDELILSVSNLSVQLENQQEIRDQLSSDIAHEIRTPLTTIKGTLEAMIDGIWEVTDERLQICCDEVDRLTRLIGSIDKINEIESHQTNLNKTYFDLYDLAKDTASNFDSLFIKKNIHFKLEGQPFQIFADKDKINQVLTNLLSNAVKFTPAHKEINLVIRKENNQAVLTLIDTGEGINTEDLAFIFERFYMSDSSRKSSMNGQGIGLSIVKSIVKAHSGTIAVKSDYGKGSTFTLTFPLM